MKRRSFLQTLAALVGAGAAPVAVLAAEPSQRVAGYYPITDHHPGANIVYLHATREGGCGAPAYLLKKIPTPGSLVRSSDFMALDGSPVAAGSWRICGSCGERMTGGLSSRDVSLVQA